MKVKLPEQSIGGPGGNSGKLDHPIPAQIDHLIPDHIDERIPAQTDQFEEEIFK